MDYIEKNHLIDEKNIDQKYYFQSFFQTVCEKGLLSEEQIQRIQLGLVDLMGKEITRYTNDESSSVRVEAAQQILQSITYCIGYFLKSTIDVTQKLDILKSVEIAELYYQGMKSVAGLKAEAYVLLQELKKSSLKLEHYAYRDTIFTALPEFFHDYDIEFGAHDISASIDYQLYDYKDELLGVEYIHDYLTRLRSEELFLRHYPADKINQLLKSFDKEAEHLLVNIFELVLNNAMGCALLGKSILELHILEKELEWLQETLSPLNKVMLTDKLMEAYEEAFVGIITEDRVIAYVKAAIPKLAGRLEYHLQTGTLDKLFLPMDRRCREDYYEDGKPMEDESLRELIEQLKDCETTYDKIALVKKCVHSTADLMELLEESFLEEEYSQLFKSFTDNEKDILQKSILYHYGIGHFEDFEPVKEWQRLLFQGK